MNGSAASLAGIVRRSASRRLSRPLHLLALSAALAVAPVARAATPSIELSEAWTRPSIGAARTGAIYVTIANHGPKDEQLLAADTPVAGKSQLHQSLEEDGIMKMRAVPSLTIKAGATIQCKPGGLHIMLFDLTQPLKAGDHFPLTLTFAQAGAVSTTVTVGAGANGPDMKM